MRWSSVSKATRTNPVDYTLDLYLAFTPFKYRVGVSPVKSGGNGESIGSTATDAIVRSWVW